MAYLDPKIPGDVLGTVEMEADGTVGQFVEINGENLANLAPGATDTNALGMLGADVLTGELGVIHMGGGIYETDAYETGIVAGEELGIDNTSKLLRTDAGTDVIVARAISVDSGVLTFKLLI